MKITYTFFMAIAAIILVSFTSTQLGKRDGTEPGYTGSPGDSLKNCTVCHGGRATFIPDWITSNVPATGYVPGQRYSFKATNTEIGGTRFGFLISPQAIDGTLLGTLLVTDTTTTKLVGNEKYVTYKAAGTEGVDSFSWVFDWVAPADTINEVIFYGAFNSNFEGHKDGDETTLSTLRLYKQGFTGLTETAKNLTLAVYPNPASNLITLQTAHAFAPLQVNVMSQEGKLVLTLTNPTDTKIEVSSLTAGIYFIQAQQADGKTYTGKFVKF
jgi:hypothetical protein